MRAAVRQAILGCAPALAAVPAERWLARGSVGPETVPQRPFGLVAEAVAPSLLRPVRRLADAPRDFEIWVHDDPGSYVRIDDVLTELSDYFEAITHFSHSGFVLAQVDPQSISSDLMDDVFRTVTKSLRIRVIGHRL